MNGRNTRMSAGSAGRFMSLAALRAACLDLPDGDSAAAAAVVARQAELTKPPGSLGRLEEIVAWLAKWRWRRRRGSTGSTSWCSPAITA